jgi:hypothetical protein
VAVVQDPDGWSVPFQFDVPVWAPPSGQWPVDFIDSTPYGWSLEVFPAKAWFAVASTFDLTLGPASPRISPTTATRSIEISATASSQTSPRPPASPRRLRSDGLGYGLLRRRSGREAGSLRRQWAHLPAGGRFPALKETFRQKSQLFLNDGEGFRDVSSTAGGGLQLARSSRGLAVGDLDNDGDLNLILSNMDDGPTLLENRQRAGHHWLGLSLKKEGTNPSCIGARVTLEAGGHRQVREVRSGGSYLSQNDLRAQFGLGANAGPVDAVVRLGQSQWRWKSLPVGRYTTLVLRSRIASKAARDHPPPHPPEPFAVCAVNPRASPSRSLLFLSRRYAGPDT